MTDAQTEVQAIAPDREHYNAADKIWRLSVVECKHAIATALAAKDAELNNLRASIEELSLRLCDAEGALWRVFPNTHTIPSDHPLGKKTPDPFEGPGETYRAAYERMQSELIATRQELGETRLVLEQTERNADRLAADVIRAAEWLHQWMPKGRLARWIVGKLYPSACLSHFEETMRDWNHLSRADRANLIYELRKSALLARRALEGGKDNG